MPQTCRQQFLELYILRLSKHYKNHKVLINAVNAINKKQNSTYLRVMEFKSSIERDACGLINQPIIRTYSRPELLIVATCDLYVHASTDRRN